MSRIRYKLFSAMVVALSIAPAAVDAEEMALDYLYRYNCQSGEPDHLLDAVGVGGDRAIVAGNRGLALVDLGALPPGGTQSYLYRLTGLNARDLYVKDGEILYVNLHREGTDHSFGFAVVRLRGNILEHLGTIKEPGVLYEKMCVAGDHLYVAAHSHGIRIFSLASPEAPAEVGRLETGFVDAFAIAVEGGTAWVADGAGGLKVVDVSDPAAPVIFAGEDLASAAGTSEDVTVRGGRVYVAAGGAGVAVYDAGDLGSRRLHATGGAAESLCWIGDDLAVGTLHGVVVLRTDASGDVTTVASEITGRRGSNGTLRICSGVGYGGSDRLLCADWNFMDVYELKPASSSTQADIGTSAQRIRFAPSGGAEEVTLTNNGGGELRITGVHVTESVFSVDYAGGTLAPGESVTVTVTYSGSGTSQGSGVVRFGSNDPDESPLPIQVFGNTHTLDPGEPAVDFTLPVLRRDHEAGTYTEEPFTLSDQMGKVVWFQVYASW